MTENNDSAAQATWPVKDVGQRLFAAFPGSDDNAFRSSMCLS